MSEKPTLVVLSPRFPYPIEKGDKLRLFHQLQALKSHFRIHLISLSDIKIEDKHLEVIDELVHDNRILLQSSHRKVKAAIRSTFGRKALQVNYYSEKKLYNKIHKLLGDINPDLIYVQLVRCAHMVMHWEGPKAIDYMDAMSLNMKREARSQVLLKRWIFRLEAQRILKAEVEYQSYFDKKFIISSPDQSYLEGNGVKGLKVISNGVDTSFFDPTDFEVEVTYDLCFVGNMGYLPNVLAAEFLVNEIVGDSSREWSVLIAGARPHQRVKRLSKKHVTVTGWVDDIRTSYVSAKLIVAPIFSGAGQQNKILEAMALGRVCVTTTQVNEAIGATDGREIVIASSREEFREKIKELLNNNEMCERIGKNARNFVVENFQWERTGELLKNELLELIK